MIQLLRTAAADFDQQLTRLLQRRGQPQQVDARVRQIIDDVRQRGDAAVLEYSQQFDRLSASNMQSLSLDAAAMQAALGRIDTRLRQAILHAHDRIQRYHQHEVPQSWQIEEADGTQLGQRVMPLQRVGVYVPGGQAAYPSSVLMTVVPAQVAGVAEIIMVVPTPDGVLNDAVLAAASVAGVHRLFTIGGAQAVAALAYGTQSVPAVDKIVGPGNAYVSAAKRMVFGDVGIDMLAGPSEVVVICDQTAPPEWVAMDLLAQAEHDQLAQSIAITDSPEMVVQIQRAVQRLLPTLPRRAIIEESLRAYGGIIEVDNLQQAAAVANRIAPEHLELMLADVDPVLQQITHAGAIFCGVHSAESLGDYCAGPSHVLPTSATARFASPLGVYDFQKRSSIIRASQAGAQRMAATAAVLAQAEGLVAHARAAEYRLA